MANEKRLIDANAFWNRLNQVVYDIFTYPERPCDYARVGYYTGTIETVLKQTKTVDAVEVVRCNKCTYWEKATVNKKGFLICQASGMEITADDFCSYGERKDNERKAD